MTTAPPKGLLIPLRKFPEHNIPTKEPKTVHEWIAKHGFPKPYRLGYRTVFGPSMKSKAGWQHGGPPDVLEVLAKGAAPS